MSKPYTREHHRRYKDHEIYLTKKGDSGEWYIQVYAPCGMMGYDGYWRDSQDKTYAEAYAEAKSGAMIDFPTT